MNVSKTKMGTATGVVGAAALIAACIPCCISLAVPLLAWLGITSLGALATSWYIATIGVFALGAAAILYVRFRRRASCQVRQV